MTTVLPPSFHNLTCYSASVPHRSVLIFIISATVLILTALYPGITSTTEDLSPALRKPTVVVPFRRDVDFVDRGDFLKRVDERCSQTAGRVALVGLGGVGYGHICLPNL